MSKNAIQCVQRFRNNSVTVYRYNDHIAAVTLQRADTPYDVMLMLHTFVRIIPWINNDFDSSKARDYKGTSHAEALREYFRTNAPVEYYV